MYTCDIWKALSLIAAENAQLVENENPPYPCGTREEIISSYNEILQRNEVFIHQNVGAIRSVNDGKFYTSEYQSKMFRG